MRRGVWYFLPFVLAGCASHYHQVSGESLHLYLKLPEAARVDFASSLDGFKIHSAEKIDSETWETTVPAGAEFRYFYFVNGKIHIPDCRMREHDGFGMENCIYEPEL
jgi:hypothetical protein